MARGQGQTLLPLSEWLVQEAEPHLTGPSLLRWRGVAEVTRDKAGVRFFPPQFLTVTWGPGGFASQLRQPVHQLDGLDADCDHFADQIGEKGGVVGPVRVGGQPAALVGRGLVLV